jgi:hypothetical protein
MNKPKATKAKPSARLDNPLTPKGALTCTIDVMALRGMTMSELRALRDALHTTHNVLSAFSCQPRFDGSSHHCKNAAGNLLEDISEWIAGCEEAVVNVAQAATPETARDAEIRGLTVLGFHADLTDDLSDFAVMASEAARDEANAKWIEDHGRLRGTP